MMNVNMGRIDSTLEDALVSQTELWIEQTIDEICSMITLIQPMEPPEEINEITKREASLAGQLFMKRVMLLTLKSAKKKAAE